MLPRLPRLPSPCAAWIYGAKVVIIVTMLFLAEVETLHFTEDPMTPMDLQAVKL